MAAAVLRPFAEGLAMFAEFDAVSRVDSEATSPLPWILAVYFAGLDSAKYQSTPEPFATLYRALDVLGAYRLNAETLEKKADLLVSPLASAYDGGYLAGYLAVKSMWRHLCEKQARLRGETDLTLAFMRSYFYDDPVLAGLILDTGDPEASSLAVATRVQRRIDTFENIGSDDVTAFEQRLIDAGNRAPGSHPSGGILVDGAVEVAERITAVLGDLERDDLSWTVGDMRRLMARRRDMTLTSVPVTLESRAGVVAGAGGPVRNPAGRDGSR
jgi:hypothetical protein